MSRTSSLAPAGDGSRRTAARRPVLVLVSSLLFVLALCTFGPPAGTSTFLDLRNGRNGFGDPANTSVEGMSYWDQSLYFATGNWAGASIYTVDAAGNITKVKDLPANDTGAPAFRPYNGSLYFGTTNDTNGASLWRIGPDGQITKEKDLGATRRSVSQMSGFNNTLYYGTINSDGSSSIFSMDSTGKLTNLHNIPNASTTGMASTSNSVWYGTQNSDGSSTVYRMDATGHTTKVLDIPNKQVSGMESYKGDVWYGTINQDGTSTLYQMNGTGQVTNHLNIPAAGNEVQTLYSTGGTLYSGTKDFANGGSVWATDGNSITPASDPGFGNTKNMSVSSLGEYNGRLFAGTFNVNSGAELWSGDLFPNTYYFAEGTTRPGFQPFVAIKNQSPTNDATVDIDFLKGDGTTQEYQTTIPPNSRGTVNVQDVLGTGDDTAHDFSATLQSTEPILPERSMYFNYKGQWPGGTDVLGATSPGSTFYFAEGTTRPGFTSYVAVANTSPTDTADVTTTFYRGDGGTQDTSIHVPPSSRATVNVNDLLGNADSPASDFSTKVESTGGVPILAERPMYFNYKGMWPGGTDVIGVPSQGTDFYFAEGTTRPGFDSYFSIANFGGSDASVQVTLFPGEGDVKTHDVTVPAQSRQTVSVNDILGTTDSPASDFSAKVESTNGQPILAERPMYFNYKAVWPGGTDVIGAPQLGTDFYFAEGTTRPAFNTYYSIANTSPTTTADVQIDFYPGAGETKTTSVSLPPQSRATIDASSVMGVGEDAAHDFAATVTSTNGVPILAERPMYFNYSGQWSGGTDVIGYTP
ncbi:MAG: WD40 repeat domain-containing protein [Actinobacteria bacterium]|nr:WD40 repeat domain-containing protein [Actinomycetota bacterium]MBU1943371.1 WD40 repeat domain-containing protein [Actinomycetota bacterium]MBU2686728.1 WD40 repeat domain-containing protein [Actinomycetota bacterium]